MVGIQAHEVQHRRVEVFHVQRMLDRVGSDVISLTMAHPALHPAAGHPHGESVGVVVAAGALLVFRRGLPTKFTAPHDQGLLEHSSLFEILD